MSWVSRTENTERPPCVRIRPFSDRVCSTIAVEDSDRTMPMARAAPSGWPSARAAAVIAAMVPRT